MIRIAIGVKKFEQLPANAKVYLKHIEEITETPVNFISTDPDREETIV